MSPAASRMPLAEVSPRKFSRSRRAPLPRWNRATGSSGFPRGLSARAFRAQGVEGRKAEEDRAYPLSCGRVLVPVRSAQECQGVCIEPLKPRCGRILSNPLQPGAKTRRGRQRHEGVQRGKVTREILDNLLDQEVAKRDPAQARLAVADRVEYGRGRLIERQHLAFLG